MSAVRPGFDVQQKEIRDYHDAFIGAHVRSRRGFFVQDLANDSVNASRGELLRQTKDEILETFTDHLDDTTFSEHRLLGEPAIDFSKAGSVARSIFRLKVTGVRRMPDGTGGAVDSTSGCLILFERRGDCWT